MLVVGAAIVSSLAGAGIGSAVTIVLPKVNDNCIMTILGNEGNGI